MNTVPKLFGQILNVLDSIKREHEELLVLLFCCLENVLHSSKNSILIKHNRILMNKIILSALFFFKKKVLFRIQRLKYLPIYFVHRGVFMRFYLFI